MCLARDRCPLSSFLLCWRFLFARFFVFRLIESNINNNLLSLSIIFRFCVFHPRSSFCPQMLEGKPNESSAPSILLFFFFYLNPLSLSQTRQDERDYLRNFVKRGARWTGFSIHACSACESSKLVFCFNLCCFPCPQRVVNCLCACFHGSLLPLPESRKAFVFVIRSCFFFPKKKNDRSVCNA